MVWQKQIKFNSIQKEIPFAIEAKSETTKRERETERESERAKNHLQPFKLHPVQFNLQLM